MTFAVDPLLCPLCGQSNQCAMEAQRATGQAQPPCWCTQVDFNRELLAQLSDAARGKACICRGCATSGRDARAEATMPLADGASR